MRLLTLLALPLAFAASAESGSPVTPLEARGVIEAKDTAEIAAPMAARLTSVSLKPGQAFRKGAVIAHFDCAAMRSELAATERAIDTLTIRHENQSELFALGAAGELDVKLAASEVAQAEAEAKALRVQLKDCTLHAPWTGTVVERHLQSHETPNLGEPVYTLQRAGASQLVIIVPSAWAGWLETGTEFAFAVDDTDERLSAKVTRLGAAVDPVSQTFEVTADITSNPEARPGMSGVAIFTPLPE